MKKKLLVITSSFPKWSGDDTIPFVYELSKRLVEDFEVTVLAPHCPNSKRKEKFDNIEVYRFRYFFERFEKLACAGGILPVLRRNKLYYFVIPFFLLGLFWALIKQVRKDRPDIIHAHWIIPQGLMAALIKKIYKIPYVVTAHGSDVFGLKGKWFNSIKLVALKNASKITVVSSAIKNEIIKKIDSNLKIEVVSMGVDAEYFTPDKKDNTIRNSYSINGGVFLLFVGRLSPEKGLNYLLNAMPDIIGKFPKTKLLIIGEGTLKQEMQELAGRLNLENNVIFLGQISNKELPKYYASADIFINSSLREGLPVTVMEAMSCRCIPVVTDLEGNIDLIKDNITGFFVEQKNQRAISQKIIELMSNPSLVVTVKSHIREEIISRFDWKIITNKYKNVLIQALV